MPINVFEPSFTKIFNFTVKGENVYFTSMTEWKIFLAGDAEYGFHVWGERAGVGRENAIDLPEILLILASLNTETGQPDKKENLGEDLARNLGRAIAHQIWLRTPADSKTCRSALILECVFRSMNICFISEHLGDEKRYSFNRCPLCAANDHARRKEIELAHRALINLLISAVHFIDPGLSLRTITDLNIRHTFDLVS